MVETTSLREERPRLSVKERLCLIQTINALPPTQFDELVFALAPPKGVVAPDHAPQGRRSKDLLSWLEGSSGPGLTAADEVLQVLIPKTTGTDPQPVAFAISGKMGDLTPSELEAIADLLRQRTGDASLSIAFSRPGSIKLILNHSPKGSVKLQKMLEAVELGQLNIPPVEAVTLVDSRTQDARKARLILTLRLPCKKVNRSFNSIIERARDLAHYLFRDLVVEVVRNLDNEVARHLDSYFDSYFARHLARDSDLARHLARDLVRDMEGTHDRALAFENKAFESAFERDIAFERAFERSADRDRSLAYGLARDLVRDLDRAIARANALVNALASALASAFASANDLDRDSARASYRALALAFARDLASAHDRAIDLARDLVRDGDSTRDLARILVRDIVRDGDLDLSNADLSGANLRYLDLVGANLTDADLTNADVAGTRFGNNSGLSDTDKRDLQSRGAIFIAPPSSDASAFVQH